MNKTDERIKELEGLFERGALAFAGLVVFGLVLEVFFAAAFHEPPETAWSHWGPVGADVIVTIGVAGEVLFGRKARRISEEMSRRSERKLAEANVRAGEAEKAAAEARERTAQLEQRIAGRSLSAEAFATLVDLFKSINPKPLSPVIEFEDGDGETHSFAGEIQHALWQAGLAPVRMRERDTGGYTLYGVFVGDVPPGRGCTLIEGLKNAGIGSCLIDSQDVSRWGGLIASADLYIWVGLKHPGMSKSQADRLFAQAKR